MTDISIQDQFRIRKWSGSARRALGGANLRLFAALNFYRQHATSPELCVLEALVLGAKSSVQLR